MPNGRDLQVIYMAYWALVLRIVMFQDMPGGTGHVGGVPGNTGYAGDMPGSVRMPGGISRPVDTAPGRSWHWLFP